MPNHKKHIGSLIQEEVAKQKISTKVFAEMINCQRGNIYKIYQKRSIDIDLLARISKALNHNFFKDLAEDLDLACTPILSPSEENDFKAACQFLEVIPTIFQKLGIIDFLISGRPNDIEDDFPWPDFSLPHLSIIFTIGESFEKKANGKLNNVLDYETHYKNDNCSVTILTKKSDKSQMCNIVIDYKTEEQWEETMQFAIDVIAKEYNSITLMKLNQLKH